MVKISPRRHITCNKTKHGANINGSAVAGKTTVFTISSVELTSPAGVKQEQMKMPESTHIPINGEPVGPITNGISSGLVSPPGSAPVLAARQPQPTALEERKSPLTSTMTMQVRLRKQKLWRLIVKL